MTAQAGPEDNAGKHLDIFNRRAARGQCFHQPCLGTREFAARFELIAPDKPLPAAIPESRDLGFMLWDIDHGREGRPSLYFRAQLENGIVRIPQPGAAEIRR
jgi:CRISPR-associated protein Cas5d